jgi:heme-degrading monooxygenase HmoA
MNDYPNTLKPPYYAVIFTSTLTGEDLTGYSQTAETMLSLAQQQDGFLGVDEAQEKVGITVSYWRDLKAIKAWKQHIQHAEAQQQGRASWYANYHVRIAKVERAYSWKL